MHITTKSMKIAMSLILVMLILLCISSSAGAASLNSDSTEPSIWDQIKDAGSKVVDKAKEKAPVVKDKASELYESAKEKAPELIDKAKDSISDAQDAFSDWNQRQQDEFWARTEQGLYGNSGNSDKTNSAAPDAEQSVPTTPPDSPASKDANTALIEEPATIAPTNPEPLPTENDTQSSVTSDNRNTSSDQPAGNQEKSLLQTAFFVLLAIAIVALVCIAITNLAMLWINYENNKQYRHKDRNRKDRDR